LNDAVADTRNDLVAAGRGRVRGCGLGAQRRPGNEHRQNENSDVISHGFLFEGTARYHALRCRVKLGASVTK